MRPPVLLRQTVISVTADRKMCRINSKSAPPIPKKTVGTCRQAMCADNDETVQTSVAPVQTKTKVVQIVLNATYTTFYFDYQRYYAQKCRVQTKCCKSLYGECTSGFRSVRAHSFQNLDHLALLRAYNVHLRSNIMPRFIWLQYTEFQMYYASV